MALERLIAAYRLRSPESCIVEHLLLANELEQAGALASLVLHHRLAAALIALRLGSDQLDAIVAQIGAAGRSRKPPSFSSIVDTMEQVNGLALQELLDTLPGGGRNGDAAIADVWQRVLARRTGGLEAGAGTQGDIPSGFWSALPAPVRRALTLEGDEMDIALRHALRSLPQDDARDVLARLHDAGVMGGMSPEGRNRVADRFEVFLKGVVAVSLGDDRDREELEQLLPELERAGWHIMAPVLHIWDGRRDRAGLCAGLDPASTRLIERLLSLLEEAEGTGAPGTPPAAASPAQGTPVGTGTNPEPPRALAVEAGPERTALRETDSGAAETTNAEQLAILEALPPALRNAFALEPDSFGDAMAEALADMPPAEAMAWMEKMFRAGLVGTDGDVTAAQALEHLDPLLYDIALIAKGRSELRKGVEDQLKVLEQLGMHVSSAVYRIWAGERDPGLLTRGLDPSNELIVIRILEHLNREVV